MLKVENVKDAGRMIERIYFVGFVVEKLPKMNMFVLPKMWTNSILSFHKKTDGTEKTVTEDRLSSSAQ